MGESEEDRIGLLMSYMQMENPPESIPINALVAVEGTPQIGTIDSYNNTFFNVGYDFQINENVDDVAYLQNLSSYFQSQNSIDPSKVFCTGMSNGGDLCYLLACEAPETFRAVAPISGMIMQDIMDECNPESEVSILEIHGTAVP